ncbi:TadE family type IV pilus minor pilin [Actinokineospora sp. NBRC 105648]|uniref:TadE family type IV pilus minor pilin n=1 Tax=Actinokineospora sp. NBRC 105648 TaxID=3032206 RepID=UPI0024A3CFC3|nr:TadE family type IV pilus minor pilin [Actinokineospora sp. NBRC 105648]GLZ40982.1 apoptosis inhibitor [Actinokineospora sp. NBRC 105648]
MTARDRGAVAVEAAAAIGALTLVFGLAVAGLSAVADQVRCLDAAREAARLVARGETERGRALAALIAPSGAAIDIHADGDTVSVVVSADGGLLPGVRPRGDAHAVVEPGSADG